MSGSVFSISLRIAVNLVNIFSILYPIYVFYYFLAKTGGYYPVKLPENGEELLRSYVEHPLMAVLNITITSVACLIVMVFSIIGLSDIMKSQNISIQLMNASLVLSGDYGLKSILAWASY